MQLDGIHHITAVTGNAPANLDFYTRVLGLRLVKKTVNQDDPTVYHLFYADDSGSPGADLTFFEYPGATRGRAGAGMVHRIIVRVGSKAALDFWADRLAGEGIGTERVGDRLRFSDPEGIGLELVIADGRDPALTATRDDVPHDMALQGFDGVRVYGTTPERSRRLMDALGFAPREDGGFELRGPQRGASYDIDVTTEAGIPGAGTVHHVAFSSTMEDHAAWREQAASGGAHPTPVIDRFYFRSIYFREPGGVLFEIATMGPGFATDEPADHLGEALSLPPDFEHLRDRLEQVLTPLDLPAAR
jgi:glyoxalase family protein